MRAVAHALAAAALVGLAVGDVCRGVVHVGSSKCGTPPNATLELCCNTDGGETCLNKAEHLCGPSPTTCAGWFKHHAAAKMPCNINATTGAPVDLVCAPANKEKQRYPHVTGTAKRYWATKCTARGFFCFAGGAGDLYSPVGSYGSKYSPCPATTQPAKAPTPTATATNNAPSGTGAGLNVSMHTLKYCYFKDNACATKVTASDAVAAASCTLGAQAAGTTCVDSCFEKSMPTWANTSSYCAYIAGKCMTSPAGTGAQVFVSTNCSNVGTPSSAAPATIAPGPTATATNNAPTATVANNAPNANTTTQNNNNNSAPVNEVQPVTTTGPVVEIDITKMTLAELTQLIDATQKEFDSKCAADDTTAECKVLKAQLAFGKAAQAELDQGSSAARGLPSATAAALLAMAAAAAL